MKREFDVLHVRRFFFKIHYFNFSEFYYLVQIFILKIKTALKNLSIEFYQLIQFYSIQYIVSNNVISLCNNSIDVQ